VKIVVAMKEIPDPAQIRIRDRKPVLEGVPLTLGAIDKNALEVGRTLKETLGATLVIVSAGGPELEDTVKEGLAMGADEAVLWKGPSAGGLESAASAELIADMVKELDDVGLVLFGEGSGDNYSGQVGPRVAALLGMPLAGCATGIMLNGNVVRAECSYEDAVETIEMAIPAVVTVMADINTPKIPSVMEILKAGKKPKTVRKSDGAETGTQARTKRLGALAPLEDRKRIRVKTADELVAALRADGVLGRD
jgi:electron transfer flavoprotein beta subunit